MTWIRSIIFFLILSTLVGQLVDGTKYKPYISLVIGFMLISLMLQPVLSLTGKEEIIQETLSSMTKEIPTFSFRESAKEAKKQQMETQIQKILKEYKIKVFRVEVEMNDNGEMKSINIQTDKKSRREKKIKTILLGFYNLKDSNINVSE
ncbi:stage III sporulation protein AF [Anaerostipes sp. MSJ-23]|uniref:stage III sporulation protein AF n=1 Tax=unclassified Anaerostipes TaxID=2635253 RepID=UPI001C0FCBA7|nr:stage III sporulation protein AF [Anaerostipes sp. MSJ-23]MBU5460959.1 stage III sporulation protein AF [Anaerostipes sp. MSJ-23]